MADILASSISGIPHLAAFDKLAEARFSALGAEMIYLIDLVHPEALPLLAEQFDVLGYKGWALTNTDEERRELLKQAIELHKYKGTPWAVKEAIRRIGYTDITIIEGAQDLYHNGVIRRRDGSFCRGGGWNWATFRVYIELGPAPLPDADTVKLLIALIDEYKNTRSRLVLLVFTGSGVELAAYNAKGEFIN